jgi:inner membrane protein
VNGVTAKLAFNAINGRCGGTAVVPVGLNGAAAVGTSIPFRAGLVLRGTQAINLLPNAQQFYLQMSGSWQTPSFTGATLPELFEVNKDGFRATWQIPGDASSGSWQIGANLPCITQANMEPSVGVELQEAMPTYQMVNRAAKYGTLFLALSFGTYFAFEAVSKVRIHLAQYVMLGLSVSLFALLLIALAEPLGFMAGYALSTLAVIGQASLYTLSVVRSVRLAAVFAAILGTLFGLLYVILSLETFALLAGTVAVFAALSGIMIVTRKVEWGGPFTPQVPPTAR